MTVVAAPYHRGNAGNLAVYRFFLGAPAEGEAIVQAWGVRYVALCADTFGDAPVGALAERLHAGHRPDWLTPVATRNRALTLYAVEPGLFPASPTR